MVPCSTTKAKFLLIQRKNLLPYENNHCQNTKDGELLGQKLELTNVVDKKALLDSKNFDDSLRSEEVVKGEWFEDNWVEHKLEINENQLIEVQLEEPLLQPNEEETSGNLSSSKVFEEDELASNSSSNEFSISFDTTPLPHDKIPPPVIPIDVEEELDKIAAFAKIPTSSKIYKKTSKLLNFPKTFACSNCRLHFKRFKELTIHTKFMHTENFDRRVTGDFVCKHCPKVLTSRQNILGHIIANHVKNMCPICGNTFENDVLLTLHLQRSHNKDCNNACDLCERKFRNETLLEQHTENSCTEYVCEECKRVFDTGHGLNLHIKKVHQ